MIEQNEYSPILLKLYNKSLTLEDPAGFHPVLGFYYYDAMAHLDYSISTLAFNSDSPRNMMSREYLKHRLDEAKGGDLARFPGFMEWLKAADLEKYERFPLFVQKIYAPDDPAEYRSFRIVLNPDDRRPVPAGTFSIMIDELFERSYLNTLYSTSKVAAMLNEYLKR